MWSSKSPCQGIPLEPTIKRLGSWRKTLKKFVKYTNEDSSGDEQEVRSSPKAASFSWKENVTATKRTKREVSNRLRFSILLRGLLPNEINLIFL